MVLRLVLVSIVAGLGCAPPADRELAGWTETVQSWLEARFAAPEVRQPLDEDEFTPVAGVAPAADPALEGLDDELIALFGEEPAAPAAVSAPMTAVPAGSELELIDEELLALFDFDEEPAAAEPAAAAVGTAQEEGDAVFARIVDEMSAEFSEPAIGDAPVFVVERRPVDPATETAAAREFEDELAEAALLEEILKGITTRSDAASAAADAPEPAPVVEESTEGQDGARHQLGAAVRLTRDAVIAWINLLQSPAIVTVPR